MAVHTFGTEVNPAHFVEAPDPAAPTDAPDRPPAGYVLQVRDAATLIALPNIATNAYGYWSYTTTDVPSIMVSTDSFATSVGPLWSRESDIGSHQVGQTATDAMALAQNNSTGLQALDTRVTTLETATTGPGGGGTFTGSVDWVTQVNNKPVIPTTAGQVGAVATTAVAAANGVASLDTLAKVPAAQIPFGTAAGTVAQGNHTHAIPLAWLPAGVQVVVTANPDGTYPARPTTRTDIVVRWRGSTPPASGGTGSVANVDEWTSR